MIGRRNLPSTHETDKPKGFDGFELRLGDVMRGERATLSKSLLDVQRELKIKASYIAAIENADMAAFETPGFVAGYVRSYARYLGMDPEWAFARFCDEAGYVPAHGLAAHGLSAAATAAKPAARQVPRKGVEHADPLANPNALFVPRSVSRFGSVQPGAIGSVLVLLALVGGIGYGGWSVLQEVQKVRLAPVEQAPGVVAELDPIDAARAAPSGTETAGVDLPQSDALERLYRPEALDVPVLIARDGPIASIDPSSVGALASLQVPERLPTGASVTPGFGPGNSAIDAALAEANGDATAAPGGVRTTAEAAPGVEIVAVRPSWVRVSAPDGAVLFEKILDAGERYAVPAMEEAPLLRAGNSGSVYFAVNGQTYGPASPGANVVKNLPLSVDSLTGSYQVADLAADPDLAKVVAVAQAQLPPEAPAAD
ncbi:helix-turn-helix domain-containing protein [Frigidibacter oleivorans]|uniref:helix-turn-helix domain-containing protein n=1 Tax=Frigidibacter oleivorans TaxID=2487129 RepID=UPI000F8DD5DC|nr:helix-turn-helix domain-containing protein [Frigidibacter oleivorans]